MRLKFALLLTRLAYWIAPAYDTQECLARAWNSWQVRRQKFGRSVR